MHNLKVMIAGMTKTCELLYKKYPGGYDIFPNQVEYRCFIMLSNLITFELLALFMPQIYKVDPWMIFL